MSKGFSKKKSKAIQYFSDEYLEQCRRLTPLQTLQFQENFRLLHRPDAKTKAISIRIEEPLLEAFRVKCELNDEKYQTKIKKLMEKWVKDPGE